MKWGLDTRVVRRTGYPRSSFFFLGNVDRNETMRTRKSEMRTTMGEVVRSQMVEEKDSEQ